MCKACCVHVQLILISLCSRGQLPNPTKLPNVRHLQQDQLLQYIAHQNVVYSGTLASRWDWLYKNVTTIRQTTACGPAKIGRSQFQPTSFVPALVSDSDIPPQFAAEFMPCKSWTHLQQAFLCQAFRTKVEDDVRLLNKKSLMKHLFQTYAGNMS